MRCPLTFQCGAVAGLGSGGRHALGAYDNSRNPIAGVKLECSAHVGDRNGDGVTGAQVSFLTEAGTIGPAATSQTDGVGNATVLYKTSLPLPLDVEPGTFSWTPLVDAAHTGELLAPLWMHPFEWREDPVGGYGGAPTLAEPRRPDPVSTLIWAAERILWTGWPDERDRDPAQTPQPTLRQVYPAAGPLALPHFGSARVQVLVTDPWFNALAQNGASDGCTAVGAVVSVVTETLAGLRYTYDPGVPIVYRVQDVHDPAQNPPPAAYPQPVAWLVSPRCQYTASDKDGQVLLLPLPAISGTVL